MLNKYYKIYGGNEDYLFAIYNNTSITITTASGATTITLNKGQSYRRANDAPPALVESDTQFIVVNDNIDNPASEHYWIFHYYGDSISPVSIEEMQIDCKEMFISAYPNPFTKSTIIHYFSTSGSKKRLEVKIYDLSGKLVNELESIGQVVWDGKSITGSEVPKGIYFIKVKGFNPLKVIKIM